MARNIYGADGIKLSGRAEENLARFIRWGFGTLPVCIAKLSTHSVMIRSLRCSHRLDIACLGCDAVRGVGFLVVISGAMMLMPALPKTSRALAIDVDENGEIIGM